MASLQQPVTNKSLFHLFFLVITFAFAACGGGGGGAGTPPSTDASLSALTISAGTLTPAFQTNTTSYSATVANAVTSLTVTATTTDSNATLTVNGTATASGANSAPIALNVGINAITVVVTAADGTTTRTYTTNVTRQNPPSTDASLSALTISAGTLTPAFQTNTTSYTATVANAVTSLTVTATATDSNATLTVNGTATASGANSAPINLVQGSNNISIEVTAEDGVTTRTYSITVTRLPAATLSALSLVNATLDQTFQSNQTSYTSGVNFLINAVRVNATLTDVGATMTVNGDSATSGADTAIINLVEGSNTITIVVTATDTVTTETYSINITRQTAASFAQSHTETGATAVDLFGVSIAIDGDTMVVGAEGVDLSGPIGDAGAVYVFTRSSGVWTQQAILTAGSNAGTGYNFGHSVAIDGDTIVVGAPLESTVFNEGAAYVFTRSGTTWSRQAHLQASVPAIQDRFGSSVAISADTIVVGTANTSTSVINNAYVFTRSGTTWSQQQKLTASNEEAGDMFGASVAIEGDTIVVGAPQEDGANSNDGAAYVFTRSSSTWTEQVPILKASNAIAQDNFGSTVAISGNSIAVGATGRGSLAGAVYVFVNNGGWSQQAFLQANVVTAGDNFGTSIDLSGERLVVGADAEDGVATNAGAAYVFMRNGTTWTQTRYVKASDAANGDSFGASVSIDGDTLVVGAREKATTGAAYVFQ